MINPKKNLWNGRDLLLNLGSEYASTMFMVSPVAATVPAMPYDMRCDDNINVENNILNNALNLSNRDSNIFCTLSNTENKFLGYFV